MAAATGRFRIEALEDRSVPAAGIPWLAADALRLSFAPDGTEIAGKASVLNAALDARLGAGWRDTIVAAFQTWAHAANINIAVVRDDGSAFGTAAALQGDQRFGDIRIGARPMGQTDVAETVAPDWAAGSWSGDVVFNTNFDFTGDYDLFTVALHEAGHSFGFADIDDPTSVMHHQYQGAWTGLAPADVAAIRSLYGARQPDAFEGGKGNDSFDRAAKIDVYTGVKATDKSVVRGDVGSASDVDFYSFQGASAIGQTVVRLQTSGISSLAARLSVYDASHRLLGTIDGAGDLELRLNLGVLKGCCAVVQGADRGAFGVGSYVLTISDARTAPFAATAAALFDTVLAKPGNDTLSSAVSLNKSGGPNDNPVYGTNGRLATAGDQQFYSFQVDKKAGPTVATIAVFAAGGDHFTPHVTVYDASGRQVAAQVLVSQNDGYVVQIADAKPGQTYWYSIETRANAATGGRYVTGVVFEKDANVFDGVTNVALPKGSSRQSSVLEVDKNSLIHFIGTTGRSADAAAAVLLTVLDSRGQTVFSASIAAGDSYSFELFLQKGQYRVVFAAAGKAGAAAPTLDFALAMKQVDDNIDPVTASPESPPASSKKPAPASSKTAQRSYAMSSASSDSSAESSPYSDPYAM